MSVRPGFMVAVLFYLLAFTAAAHAECAWVLWGHETKTYRVENKTNTNEIVESWQPLAASATEGACDNKLKDQMVKMSRVSTAKSPQGETLFHKVTDGHIVSLLWFREGGSPDERPLRTQTFSYSCLPDTIDPRGPKGK